MPAGMKREVFMKLNKHLPMLILCALFAAMTMIFKRIAVVNIDWLRLSLENTPVLLAGILFGPVAGFATGMVGDIIGCIYCGFGINPVITLGMALAGGICGLLFRYAQSLPTVPKLICSVYAGHIVGNMIVKTLGIYWWYGTPWPSLLLRIPTYLIIGAVEIVIFYILLQSKALVRQLQKIGVKI